MEDMNRLIKLLGYSHSVSRKEKEFVKVIRRVFLSFDERSGGIVFRPTRPDSGPWDSSIEVPTSSFGWRAGLRPVFVDVKLNNRLPIKAVAKLIGWDMKQLCAYTQEGKMYLTREARRFLNLHDSELGLVELRFTPMMPPEVLKVLMFNAMNCSTRNYVFRIDVNSILPAHPGWISMDDGFRICIQDPSKKSLSWNSLALDLGWDVKSSFQRAGKDIWSTGEWLKKVRLMVVPQPAAGGLDGHFVVREAAFNSGRLHCLVRGMVLNESGTRGARPMPFVKGRMVVSDAAAEFLPNGERLPADVDGWTTPDQFKYVKVQAGKTIYVQFLDAKSEVGHEKDQYKTNLMLPLMGRVSQATLDHELKAFFTAIERVSVELAHPEMVIERQLELLKNDTNGGVRSSEICKLAFGMATKQEKERSYETMVRRIRSRNVPGAAYPSIVFAESYAGRPVTPTQPGMSSSLFRKAARKRTSTFMVIRYPVTCYQSYLGFEDAIELPGISGEDMLVLHPSLAAYMQGDDDDHALILWGFESEFKAGNGAEPLIRAEGVELLDMARLGIQDLYFYGWRAQSSIGPIFNMMLKSVAACKDMNVDEETMTRVIRFFGSALDTCAQAIKKPYVLPEIAKLEGKLDAILKEHKKLFGLGAIPEKSWLTLAEINTNKGKNSRRAGALAADVFSFFDLEMPVKAGGLVTLRGCPVPSVDRELAIGLLSEVRKTTTGKPIENLAQAKEWHNRVLTALARKFGEEKLNVAFRNLALIANEAADALGNVSEAEKAVVRNSVLAPHAGLIAEVLDTYAGIAFTLRRWTKNPKEAYTAQLALSTMDGVLVLANTLLHGEATDK